MLIPAQWASISNRRKLLGYLAQLQSCHQTAQRRNAWRGGTKWSGPTNPKGLYEIMGVTPNASQSEIKAAYYKLSQKYHPDKNKESEEAVQRFRDITEAYDILGSPTKRMQYDRGGSWDAPGFRDPEEPIVTKPNDKFTQFYHSRDNKPPRKGRDNIYNYDEWADAHYGDLFNRTKEDRERIKKWGKVEKKMQAKMMMPESITLATVVLIIAIVCIKFLSFEDEPKVKYKENK